MVARIVILKSGFTAMLAAGPVWHGHLGHVSHGHLAHGPLLLLFFLGATTATTKTRPYGRDTHGQDAHATSKRWRIAVGFEESSENRL
jgi:hypothetical protein